MRTGSCTLQHALTSEASSVLKHALGLAKRRGHAQVTPLHVAAVMLSSSASAAGLFRRACLRTHHHNSPHPLHCRALELCFNVALNRLPTLPPPTSSTPALSNALVAALKRAQAHQRRGSIEQQQQQQPQQQQHQQHLLSVKVELEQLIISILDDPSVSRVMKEAGFSSTHIKNNLEEDPSSSSLSCSSFDAHRRKEIISTTSFWSPLHSSSSEKEDLRLVVDVLLGKTKGRGSSNAVVVGDSAAYSECLVAELMWRVEKGDVPEELRCVQFVKFELPSFSMGLLSRGEVEMKVADLRKKVCSMASGRGGAVVYVGDLKWAIGEEEKDEQIPIVGYRAVDHVVAEVGRMLSELRSYGIDGDMNSCSKVRLLAVANLQTFMRCKKKKPLLESQWGLHPLFVPSGGLALSLHSPSGPGSSRMTTIPETPFLAVEVKPSDQGAGPDKLMCCAECTSSFQREASMLKSGREVTSPLLFIPSEAKDGASTFPFLLQPHELDAHQQDALVELRRKWNRLCQSLCHMRHGQIHLYTPLLNHPWLSDSHSNLYPNTNSFPFQDLMPKTSDVSPDYLPRLPTASRSCHERDTQSLWPSEPSLDSQKRSENWEVGRTSLAWGGCFLFSDSATSADQKNDTTRDRLELGRRLKENIPWQSETIGCVLEALFDKKSDKNDGCWLLLQGSDAVGKQRLSRAIAEFFCGSADRLVHINTKGKSLMEVVSEALRKDTNGVFLIEGVEWEEEDFLKNLSEISQNRSFKVSIGRVVDPSQAIFLLSIGSDNKPGLSVDSIQDRVIKVKLHMEEPPTMDATASKNHKRKVDSDDPCFDNKMKNPRTNGDVVDLNISIANSDGGDDEEDDETVPSDLTQESDAEELRIPHGFLRMITARIVMDMCPDRAHRMSEHFWSKLLRSFEEAGGGGRRGGAAHLSVDQAAVEELAAAAGTFLDNLFDEWLREVFQSSLPTATKGGKLRLWVEGKEGNVAEFGFQGSTLPNRILVE